MTAQRRGVWMPLWTALLLCLGPFCGAFAPALWRPQTSFWRANLVPCSPVSHPRTGVTLRASATTTSGSAAVRSQPPSPTNATHLQMVSFYRFRSLDTSTSMDQVRDDVFEALSEQVPGVRGSLYLANEGFNGQFAIPVEQMEPFGNVLAQTLGLDDPHEIINLGDIVPIDVPTFQRLIVRTRDAILRDGINLDLDWDQAGDELPPELWHEELQSSDNSAPYILDCRNDYESDQGTFQQAIPLNTTTFSESWDALQNFSESVPNKNSPVFIFCTGGIRCVKVGAYMKQSLGFTNVKRLKHGIIGYQKWHDENAQGPNPQSSLWEGENFLFDKRRFAKAEGGVSNDEGEESQN